MVVPADVLQAAERGDVAAVKFWLDAGGDANDYTSTSQYRSRLLSALCTKPQCVSVVSLLLEHGAEINSRSLDTVLQAAIWAGRDMLSLLLSHGADPSPEGMQWTALHAASRNADHEIVAMLLDHGADPNRCMTYLEEDEGPTGQILEGLTNDPPTPLMCAAESCKSIEIIRLLLSRGADFELRTLPSWVTGPVGFNAEDYARTGLPGAFFQNGRDVREAPTTREEARELELADKHGGCDDRLPGEVEGVIELLSDVRAAGSWKRYVNEPRRQLLSLQKLYHAKRASPRASVLAALYELPPPLVWTVLKFWRSSRDAGAPEPNPRLLHLAAEPETRREESA